MWCVCSRGLGRAGSGPVPAGGAERGGDPAVHEVVFLNLLPALEVSLKESLGQHERCCRGQCVLPLVLLLLEASFLGVPGPGRRPLGAVRCFLDASIGESPPPAPSTFCHAVKYVRRFHSWASAACPCPFWVTVGRCTGALCDGCGTGVNRP